MIGIKCQHNLDTHADSFWERNLTSRPQNKIVEDVRKRDDANHLVLIIDHNKTMDLGLDDPLHHGKERLVLAALVHPLKPLVPVFIGLLQGYVQVGVRLLCRQVNHIKLCININQAPLN